MSKPRVPSRDPSSSGGPSGSRIEISGAPTAGDDAKAISAWYRQRRHRRLVIELAAIMVLAIAGGLTGYFRWEHARRAGTVARVTALAIEPGQKTSPSFSPDGRYIVYSWRRGDAEHARLVVRPVAGGGWRALTSGAASDEYPSWSPTGNRIAFERITPTDCSVFLISPDGAGEQRIGDCNFGAAGPLAWTPDGGSIIFSHRADLLDARRLVSFNVGTRQLSGVTEPVVGMPGDTEPAPAPNGRRLAFARSHSVGVADLSLLDRGTAAVERITHDDWPLAGVTFERDNRSLVFASRRGGRFGLWRSRLDGSPPALLFASANELRAPTVSADGRWLAFEEWQRKTNFLQVAPMPGGTAPDLELGQSNFARQPQLSPDRGEIVYVSNQGGHDQLWLAPASGGKAHALAVADADYLETPRWSPDGRVITFASARSGRLDVWTVTVADGHLERMTSDGESRAPSFSHDGHWLYFATAQSGMWQIWRRSWPDGRELQALTTTGGLAALESPDGNNLYYVRPDRPGLWLRDPRPGGDPMIIIDGVSPADWCNWAMTEGTIWFVQRPDVGAPEVSRYSIATHVVTQVMHAADLLASSGMTVAPDGTSIIVTRIASAQADLELASLD